MNGPPDTAMFLAAAAEVAAIQSGRARSAQDRARIASFADLYRAWIIRERGMADAPQAWAEKSSILLHLMVGGATVGEAVQILVKFRESVWGPQTRLSLDDRGADLAIVVDEPLTPGPAGLVCELWPLVVALSHLEFLAGGELDGARAEVRHGPELPGPLTNLLLGKPIAYEAEATALVIGASDLGRAVVVRSADVADFQARFMHALVDRPRGAGGMRARVSTLIWNDAARDPGGLPTMPGVAERLGLSTATLWRRLGEEGTSFQAIKEEVLDQLAKGHLGAGTQSIETIAAQLGYSDAHAFRRAFRRRNGMSPRDFRRTLRAAPAEEA
jgi:AraC-like DNA-binding protein